jgi:hypothetical protein
MSMLSLVDELVAEITKAKGIAAAIAGLREDPVNDDMREGVVVFQLELVDRLTDIKNGLDVLRTQPDDA